MSRSHLNQAKKSGVGLMEDAQQLSLNLRSQVETAGSCIIFALAEIFHRIIFKISRKNHLTSLDISEVNTVWTWGHKRPPLPPISEYFNKKRVPSGIRTHDLPHDGPRRYSLRHKSLNEATHGKRLILS